MNILFAKFKVGAYQSLGDKITGFVYSELYDSTVLALLIWGYGIMLVVKGR